MLQTALNLFSDIRSCLVIDEGLRDGFERVGTGRKLADRMAAPHQTALFRKVDFRVRRVVETVRRQMEMRL